IQVIYGSPSGLSATFLPDHFVYQDIPDVEDGAEEDDSFGSSMAAGDFNGDGRDDLAIGVPGEGVGVPDIPDAGAVNVIYSSSVGLSATAVSTGDGRTDQFWHQDSPNVELNADEEDFFGYSLAAGDFNGDGRDDLAIGVPSENISSSVEGAVNVIYGVAGTTYLNSGLAAKVPLGGSGRADQYWSQASPDINGGITGSEDWGYSLARGS
ncbi:MAG TPA: FG-GAP repeat protein, partial [Nitrososphaera sp.]|nr:FG-GAP repeat protein [Nitrososphaera sp.]